MNNPLQTKHSELEEEDEDENKVQETPVNRLRSHSLNPNYSRELFTRRKSAADVSTHLELSRESQEYEQTNTPPPRRTSPSMWSQRRFTAFSLEQPVKISTNQPRRMTTGRVSNADLLRPRRPKILTQMMEVEDKEETIESDAI